jgi:hypothetical protein
MTAGRPRELQASRQTSINIDDKQKGKFIDAINSNRPPHKQLSFSQAIREYMDSVIEEHEKNEEATGKIDLSAIRVTPTGSARNNSTIDIFNISNWLQTTLDYFRRTNDLQQVDMIKPKAQEVYLLLNGKQLAGRSKRRFV